jgi:hypothetical protein
MSRTAMRGCAAHRSPLDTGASAIIGHGAPFPHTAT